MKKHIGIVLFNLSLDHPSGSISYVKGLATYLVQKGFNVTVFCNDYIEKVCVSYNVYMIPTKRLFSWEKTILDQELFQDFVQKYTKEICSIFPPIDLIIFQHQVGSNEIATNIKALLNIPTLSVVHGTDWHELNEQEREKYIISGLNIYDALVCPSEIMKENVLPHYQNKDGIILSFPGINSIFLQNNIWKSTGRYVLFVGRLIKEKGVIEGIDAFLQSDLYQKDKMKLYIIGDGDLYGVIQEMYKEEIRAESIVCLGVLDQLKIYKFMKKAYCLIFPSIWNEPFGLVLIEAMAVGLPIIAINVGVVQMILGKDYPFISQGVVEFVSVINKYRTFLGKEVLSKEIQKKSKRFQWEEVSEDLFSFINKCI